MNIFNPKSGKDMSASVKIFRLWLLIVPSIVIYVYVYAGTGEAGTVSGIVLSKEDNEDISVYLCDGETGMPLSGQTNKPVHWFLSQNKDVAEDLVVQMTDDTGRFSFRDVPEGSYRLIAQTWVKNKASFEHEGAVIKLMGTAEDIQVDSPDHDVKPRIALCPPPGVIFQIKTKLSHDEGLIFFSTSQPEFDAILGVHAPGDAFWKNITGFNRMPKGTTTALNASSNSNRSFAFIMTNGNPEGFALKSINAIGNFRPATFIGPGANHKKSPPDELNELGQFLETHKLRTEDLLELPPVPADGDPKNEYEERMEAILSDLHRVIKLPEGRKARVGDLLAIQKYKELAKDAELNPVNIKPDIQSIP